MTWKGWGEPTSGVFEDGSPDEWIELSHALHKDLPGIDYFPPARFERLMSMPGDPLNLTQIEMVCHFGTHVDAPCHFIPDGPTIAEVPLSRLCGPGVVWRLEVDPLGNIGPSDLKAARPRSEPGDIVLLDTGWSERIGSPTYAQHPSLSRSAAEWLVENKIKLLGVDFPTPDLTTSERPEGFDWPVHQILLSHGVLIAENLTRLSRFGGLHVEVMFLPLRIEGADGAPAIVLARRRDVSQRVQRR